MSPSLSREKFLDRVWGPADLDAAAEFWLKLYEAATKANSFAPTPTHQIELRLSGFPRAEKRISRTSPSNSTSDTLESPRPAGGASPPSKGGERRDSVSGSS